MFEKVVLRTVAALATAAALALVASAVVHGSSGAPEEGWMRLVARLALAAVLLQGARLAWRRPQGADERLRRRLLRLVAVMSREELLREYAESTPSVEPTRAVLLDWESSFRAASALDLGRIFSLDQVEALRSLDAALRLAEPARPAGAAASPAWAQVRETAARAFQAVRPRSL